MHAQRLAGARHGRSSAGEWDQRRRTTCAPPGGGRLCGTTGPHQVVDAHVDWHARSRGHLGVTSDPDDLLALERTLPLVTV